MATIDGKTGVVTREEANGSLERVAVATAHVTVTREGLTDSATAEVYQAAAGSVTYEYSDPVVVLEYPVAAATAESVAPSRFSYSQTATGSDGSVETITSGASVLFSTDGENYVDPDDGTMEMSANTSTGQRSLGTVTVRVSLNGRTGTATAEVFQAGADSAKVTYGTLTGTLSYADIAAAGGSADPVLAYELPWTDTDGGSGTLTSGATVSYAAEGNPDVDWERNSAPSLTARTGRVTVGANDFDGRTLLATITATVTLEDRTIELEAGVYQEGAVVTYSDPVVTLAYPQDVPAAGGTASPTYSYSQAWTSTSGRSGTITDGGELDFTFG